MTRAKSLVTYCPGCGAEGSLVHDSVCTTTVLYVAPDFGTVIDIGTDRLRGGHRCIHCAREMTEDEAVEAAIRHGRAIL